jgi:hypothetical protein
MSFWWELKHFRAVWLNFVPFPQQGRYCDWKQLAISWALQHQKRAERLVNHYQHVLCTIRRFYGWKRLNLKIVHARKHEWWIIIATKRQFIQRKNETCWMQSWRVGSRKKRLSEDSSALNVCQCGKPLRINCSRFDMSLIKLHSLRPLEVPFSYLPLNLALERLGLCAFNF